MSSRLLRKCPHIVRTLCYYSWNKKKSICISEQIGHWIGASSEMKSLKLGRWLGLWKRDEWGEPSYKVTICYCRDTKTGLPQEGVKKREECDIKEMKFRPRVEPWHYWFTNTKEKKQRLSMLHWNNGCWVWFVDNINVFCVYKKRYSGGEFFFVFFWCSSNNITRKEWIFWSKPPWWLH